MFQIEEEEEEEDNRPEFNFGQDEVDFEEVQEWIGHFKSFKPALEPKYLNMLAVHQHVELSSSHNPPIRDSFDLEMPDPYKYPKLHTNFGVNSINNIISTIPDQPVLNIKCQS